MTLERKTAVITGSTSGIPDLAQSENISEEDARRKLLARQPPGRFVTVDEVASLVTFLAGDSAASITGANYSIDGGWTAH